MEESKKGRWRGKPTKTKAQLTNTDGQSSCEMDRHKSRSVGASCPASITRPPSAPDVLVDAKQLVHEDPNTQRAGLSEDVETCTLQTRTPPPASKTTSHHSSADEDVETCTLQTRTPSPASKTTSHNSSADEDDWVPVPTRRRKPSTVNETRPPSSNHRQGTAKIDVAKGQIPKSAPPLAPAVKRNNPAQTGTATLSSLQPADLSGLWKDSLGQSIEVCSTSSGCAMALFNHSGQNWSVNISRQTVDTRQAIVCGKFELISAAKSGKTIVSAEWRGLFKESDLQTKTQPRRAWTRHT